MCEVSCKLLELLFEDDLFTTGCLVFSRILILIDKRILIRLAEERRVLKSDPSSKAILARTKTFHDTGVRKFNNYIIIVIQYIESISIPSVEHNSPTAIRNTLALIASETTRNQSPGRLFAPLYLRVGEILPSEHAVPFLIHPKSQRSPHVSEKPRHVNSPLSTNSSRVKSQPSGEISNLRSRPPRQPTVAAYSASSTSLEHRLVQAASGCAPSVEV